MSLVVPWLAFPAVALAVAAGLGLLLRRIAAGAIPGLLVLPLGLAALFAVAQMTTYFAWSAPLTLPLVVTLAVAGWALAIRAREPLRPRAIAVLAFLATFVALGLPVLLSGHASLGGYTVLGDTAVHLIGADELLHHGRSFSSLPPSTYRSTLESYYASTGYPSGGAAAVGVLTRLVGADVFWTFQPFLALLSGMLALTMLWLLRRFGAPAAVALVGAVVSSQPELLYALGQSGSVKEVGAAAMIPLTLAAGVAWADRHDGALRPALPVVVAAAAGVAAIGVVIVVWIAPLVALVVLRAWSGMTRVARRLFLRNAALLALAGVVLAYQSLASSKVYVSVTNAVLTNQNEVGNLLKPLSAWQSVGVWLSGDYRLDPKPDVVALSNGLVALVVFAAILGAVEAIRRRAWVALGYLLVSLVVMEVLVGRGSPYADTKPLAITGPAFLFAAFLGVGALVRAQRGFEGVLVLAAVTGGVAYSNALAFHDASLAPHGRFAELEAIGHRLGSNGPTLLPDWDELAKHFVRDAAPEGPYEPFAPRRPLQNEHLTDIHGDEPASFQPGASVDLDVLGEPYVTYYRTIVMRSRPSASRPMSIFRRTFHGRWYDVFTRDDALAKRLVAHLPVGAGGTPAARPECGKVRRLAKLAGPGGRLVYAQRPPLISVAALPGPTPGNWPPSIQDPQWIHPQGPGRMGRVLHVPTAGRYTLWLGGSFGRPVTMWVDGRRIGSVGYRLNFRGPEERVGDVELTAGRHEVVLTLGGGDLHPGNGTDSPNRIIGPIELSRPDPLDPPLHQVDARRWRSLCAVSVDWIDAWRR